MEAKELQEQGVKLFQQYDYEKAQQTFEQAREAYEAEGNEALAAEMKVNIGLVHRAMNQGQLALEMMQEALTTFRDSEDALRMAQTLGNMGSVYAKMDDKEQAYNCYRQAADIFDELDETDLYGQTMLAMGDLQFRDGKIMQSAATYQVGLQQMENLTATQKAIKGLSGLINRFNGGQTG